MPRYLAALYCAAYRRGGTCLEDKVYLWVMYATGGFSTFWPESMEQCRTWGAFLYKMLKLVWICEVTGQ